MRLVPKLSKMEASSMVQIDRTSSIEREPKTLSIQQIESARDLAIYVLNTKSMEEASRIFTEGLEPVVSAACRWGSNKRMDMESREELEYLNTAVVAPPFKDRASAPF